MMPSLAARAALADRACEHAESPYMSRGLFVFFIQMLVFLGVTGIGVWALARPRNLQQFIHSNFALLPGVKAAAQITPVVLRLAGAFALWYGYMLFGGLCQELSSLGFGRLFG
jgi:hypothetical protein